MKNKFKVGDIVEFTNCASTLVYPDIEICEIIECGDNGPRFSHGYYVRGLLSGSEWYAGSSELTKIQLTPFEKELYGS